MLRCAHFRHSTDNLVASFEAETLSRTFKIGQGLPGRVWLSRKSSFVSDLASDSNFPRAPAAGKDNIHSGFAVPIFLGGEILGVFEFFSHEIRQPDHEFLELISDFGRKIGLFIERKRLAQAVANELIMRHRDEFLGALSHELMNPLLGAERLLDLFIQGTLGSLTEQQITLLTQLKESNRSVVDMIKELVEAYMLERKSLFELAPADLSSLLRNSLEGLKKSCGQRQIELKSQVPHESRLVNIDCQLLQRALDNLLEQAIKRTPDSGIVEVELTSDDEVLTLLIKSGGSAVTDIELEKTLQLRIGKMILEAHKGSLQAGPGDGTGTTFKAVLPVLSGDIPT